MPVAGALVLTLALAVAAALVGRYRDVREELHRLDAIEALASAPRVSSAPLRPATDEQRKHAQAVVRQLGLPWPQIIESLERTAMREVEILSVQPDAHQGIVRLTAMAGGEHMMLKYLQRLGASGRFADVHLLSHQVRDDDPQRRLQFSVQASLL